MSHYDFNGALYRFYERNPVESSIRNGRPYRSTSYEIIRRPMFEQKSGKGKEHARLAPVDIMPRSLRKSSTQRSFTSSPIVLRVPSREASSLYSASFQVTPNGVFRRSALVGNDHQEVSQVSSLLYENLVQLLCIRLEAATSRLEDLANLPPANIVTGIQNTASSSLNSASTEPTPVPPPHASSAHAASAIQTPRSVEAYDETVIAGKVNPFVELTKSFSVQSVIEQVRALKRFVARTP